jgi:hypothetical protein
MKKEPKIKERISGDSLYPYLGGSSEKTLSIIRLNVIDCLPMG